MKRSHGLAVASMIACCFLSGCASRGMASWHAFRAPTSERTRAYPPVIQPAADSPSTTVRAAREREPIEVETIAYARTTNDPRIPATATSGVASRPVAGSIEEASLMVLGEMGELDSILRGHSGNVVVDFYADWCGPCRRLGKTLHALEGEAREHHAKIVKVNIDAHPELAQRFGVKGLPTIVLVQNGREMDRHTGLVSEAFLRTWFAR